MVCPGSWPVWSQDGKLIVTAQPSPNQTYLAAYTANQGNIALAPVQLSGSIYGMDIKPGLLPQPLPASLLQTQQTTKTQLWTPALTTDPSATGGRFAVVPLEDITAPNPYLHDQVDESFNALRNRIAKEVGWDFLSSLENAFVPLTSPLPPDMGNDWLYTGRAFAFNPLPLNAGWMAVIREDSGDLTYWHIYLKTRYQDGSQGIPLHQKAWDLNARYTGDPQTYEQGGQLTARIPTGYWFDFTELAASYGWSRVPALYNWRTYYPGTLFNRYVMPDGLDWRSAMLEIYPPEIMITPTDILSPTPTVTQTPRWMRPRTDTPTVTPTATATYRPTWTPVGNPVIP